VLDLLSRLVDKSLVLSGAVLDGSRRYRMLETVRQYVCERLAESGDAAAEARNRHLAVFSNLARKAEPELTSGAQIEWLNRLAVEHDNLRAALEWGLSSAGNADEGAELAGALWWFWVKRGYFAEGQRFLERAAACGRGAPPAVRAKVLLGLGSMTFFQGDFARACAVLGECAGLARATGDAGVVSFALGISAIAAKEIGDQAASAALAEEANAAGRACDVPWMRGPSLSCLAYEALDRRDFARAARLHEEVLDLGRQQRDKWSMGIVLFDLAVLRIVQGRHPEARALCAEGIALSQEFGDRRGIAWCIGVLAGADAAEGEPLRAATLRGAMEGLLATVGAPVQPSYNTWIAQPFFGGVQRTLGPYRYERALVEGRGMSLGQAIDYALAEQA
jgi:non-specific serine/threonine protein kinase